MAARKSPTQIANAALDAIAKHEKECGERWAEATHELKALSLQVRAHSERWEKLAWIVIGSVLTGAVAIVVKEFWT